MARSQFDFGSFGIRWLFSVILVFATYNPEGLSYYDWVMSDPADITPLKLLCGLILIIGWVIFLRATARSLGPVGITLALALFATLVWLVIDLGLVSADSPRVIAYLSEFVLSSILAIGMSWSHIRRRMSGQLDVDDRDEE